MNHMQTIDTKEASEAPHAGPGKQRFVVLDALRGYAAIMIMIYHFKPISPLFASYLAVDFFLILSGFVLTHAYFCKEEFSFWSFAQARFARLYPLHLLTLLASLGVYLLVGRYIDKSDLLLHAFMLHNIGLGPDSIAFNSPSWSIAVEFWVNLAIGASLLYVLPSLKQRYWRWASLLFISYIAFAMLAVSPGHLNGVEDNLLPFVNMGLMRGFGSFCVGIVIYEVFVYVRPKLTDQGLQMIGQLTPWTIILFAMSLLVPLKETALDFLFVPFFALVVFLAAFERGRGVRGLARFSYLGSISFAVYLVHRPIQQLFAHILDGAGGLPAHMVLSMITIFSVAYLAHHYFELPVNKLVKAWLRGAGNLLKAQFPR